MHPKQPKSTVPAALSAAIAAALTFLPAAGEAASPAQVRAFSAPQPALALADGSVRLPFAYPGSNPSVPRHAASDPWTAWMNGPIAFGSGSSPWIEQKVIAADGQVNALFGFRVLIAGDLAFVSAPAPLAGAGAVYVYERNGELWEEVQKISGTPPDGTPPNWSDFFGWSLALSGDTLVVGAPDVFNPMMGPVGGAYVFTRSGDGVWTENQLLGAPVPATLDMFGGTSAFSEDAILVGAWSRDGGSGAVFVFQHDSSAWEYTQQVAPADSVPGDGHQFGSDIATAGNLVLVGAAGPDWTSTGEYAQGAAYVFENSAGTLSELQRLTPADGAEGDQFGFSVALDGTTALVGAPAADIGAIDHQGAAYVFDSVGGEFSETAKLVATDGAAFDQFGQAVALHDGFAVIGMWSHNDDPEGATPPPTPGVVHAFDGSGGTWNPAGTVASSDGNDGDSFGWDVTYDGATVLIGADADADIGVFQGSAYFYVNDAVYANGFDGN